MAKMLHAAGQRGSAADGPPSADTDDLDDYYKEIDDIEQATKDSDDTPEDEPKTPDEGEPERDWLEAAGYRHLVSQLEEGKELEEDLLSKETASLTRTQAAAVKRRVETLNQTIREKHRNKQKIRNKVDVRKIFDQPTESELADQDSRSSSGRLGRRANKRADHGSFLKRTGGYSMSRSMNDEPDSQGIETISIQSKGAPESRPPPNASSTSATQPATPEPETNSSFSIDTSKQRASGSSQLLDGELPNLVLQRDSLGVTRVGDISRQDMERVRALALIELTALFDSNNITFTRHKAKKRLKDHGVFGVPLATLLEHDQKRHPSLQVPKIFLELISFTKRHGVTEEGILRVPGSQTRIKALRAEIEAKFNADKFLWDDVLPNDAAGLLKQFIRELPAPLLTFEYLDAFAQVENVQELSQKVQALNLLVLLLPEVHRNTLQMLLEFLRSVVENVENLMNLHNVSMIMAPNLFLVASGQRKKAFKQADLRMAAGTATIVRMLIKYQELLWSIPSFIISQIRQKYEADQVRKFRDKPIMKLLGRKEKAETYRKPAIHQETDYQEGIIRVLAPHINKYLTPIQLDSTTTANDVVNKFRRRTVAHPPSAEHSNGKFSSPNEVRVPSVKRELPHDELHLYEVGGNIGERRLDPTTSMLTLLHVNPNAEWIVKVTRDTSY